ncbi:MAG: HAMP domain-containing protein, partial [Proteobacteria bacterium]|nr:HAMP domain-containing protein [Pseudomonadota bacterium]
KYKLLGVFLLVVVSGISTFFFFTRKTFLQDKKLFVLDWSLTTLKASTSEIKLELKGRLDELQVMLPRLFSASESTPISDPKVTQGLSNRLGQEVLAVTFYQATGGNYSPIRKHTNKKLLESLGLKQDALKELDSVRPLSSADLSAQSQLILINRSAKLLGEKSNKQLPVLTLIFNGNMVSDPSSDTAIAVDITQDFLQKTLKQSELATLFLVSRKGDLVSHPDDDQLLTFSSKPFDHPVLKRIQTTSLPREALEIEINNEAYLANLANTGIGDVYLVSQIKQSDAFRALSVLTKQSFQIGLLIISLALIASVVFSAKLTENIKKLESAAREIGTGNFDLKMNITSGDEVEKVASAFEWMTGKIVSLLKETAEKARMEEELATASLIQNTILTPPQLQIDSTEVVPFYKSASECGGDLWDAFVKDNKLTVLLGDATGHGAPAAIVTAVVKSCIATLTEFHTGSALTPTEMLTRINEIVFQSCKGQLLMTMSVAQLDLDTGLLTIANAGHEAPFYVRPNSNLNTDGKSAKPKAEALFVRGERLGFQAHSQYESLTVQLEPGDTVLVYSDGISEANNPEGKIWGERALKNTFAALAHEPLDTIKSSLVKAVDEFAQGAPQKDDITFVLFGWKKAHSQLNSRAA